MVDILHRIGVKSSPEDVYAALTTIDGRRGWWTETTKGDTDPGGVIEFRFAPVPDGFDMKVTDAKPNELLLWEVVDGPEEWVGTHVRFELKQEDGFTILLFSHVGWREPVEFMHHCGTKWATYLMSLKKYVETGQGEPSPRDVLISNWQ